MLTPKYPLEQFPPLKSAANNFLDNKSYRTLSWKRSLTEQVLVLLVMMVAVAMGKAQSTSIFWPELAIGTYLVLFRGARSLFTITVAEFIALKLHHFNLVNVLMIVTLDSAFIGALILSLNTRLDKIIAFQSAKSRITFMIASLSWLVPYCFLMSRLLPHHTNSLSIYLISGAAFLSLLPAAFIWERFIPEKNQFDHPRLFIGLMLTTCIAQVLTSLVPDRLFLILDGISMIIILFMTHKAWGQFGSSLLLAITSLTLALAWHG